MKKTLSVLAAVILTLGSAGAAEKPESDPAEAILSSMTLRDKAAQMMIASFRIWKEAPETEDGAQAQEETQAQLDAQDEWCEEPLERCEFPEEPEERGRLTGTLITLT